MLQICSGKLFQREVEYRNQLRGVIYTNLRLTRNKELHTVAGSLLPTSNLGPSNAVVYEIEELIENSGVGKEPGILVSHGIDPYINDFSAILSFALNCTASPSYALTDRLLSEQRGLSTFSTPKKVVKRTFDTEVFCKDEECEYLSSFTEQLIGLERKTYLGVMRAIRTYVTGIHRIADDFELAYTLLVASLESLAQDFDGHKGSWSDYDHGKRKIVENALSEVDGENSEKVRKAILEIEHTSLGRRFRDFSMMYIKPSFYRDEAVGMLNPIGEADLNKALSKAYQARSQYIHKLKKLPGQLTTIPSYSHTCRIGNETWLTIQGLSRLARHVIAEFVMRQPSVDKEKYDYSLERAGVALMPMAPQYWMSKINFNRGSGGRKLGGFLSQLADHMLQKKGAAITDIRGLLTEVEERFDNLEKPDKLSFASLYILFNKVVSPEQRTERFEQLASRFEKLLHSPSPQSILVHLVFNIVPGWDIEKHHACLLGYFKKRNNKLEIRAPQLFEGGMLLQLAERYRESGKYETAVQLIGKAVENSPGHSALMQCEKDFDQNIEVDWRDILLPISHEKMNKDNMSHE